MKGADFSYTDHEEAIFSTLSKNCPNLETLKIDILIKGGCFQPLPKLKYPQFFPFLTFLGSLLILLVNVTLTVNFIEISIHFQPL